MFFFRVTKHKILHTSLPSCSTIPVFNFYIAPLPLDPPLYWYTLHFLIWTKQTLFYQLNSSVLSRIYFWSHIVQGDIVRMSYCQATPPPPPNIFPSWAPLPRGKGICGIAFNTDPVVNHNYLSNKHNFESIAIHHENSGLLFTGNFIYSAIYKPLRNVRNPCYFFVKKSKY